MSRTIASASLGMGTIDEWNLPDDLTEDEIGQINDAIGEWEDEDPDGYCEIASRRLDRRVAAILGGVMSALQLRDLRRIYAGGAASPLAKLARVS